MNEIEIILCRQQCLEYVKNLSGPDLKKFTEQPELPDEIRPELSGYIKKLKEECRRLLASRSARGIKLFRRFLLLLYILSAFCIAGSFCINVSMRDETQNAQRIPWDSGSFQKRENLFGAPQEYAMAELDKGYQSAKKVYLEAIHKNPYGFANYIGYSGVCVQEGNYDEAASVLVYYMNEQFGIENIGSNNLVYNDLKKLRGPFSDKIQEKYDACISDCQKWNERFCSLDMLLEEKKYEELLAEAEQMKKEGSSDSALFPYIAKVHLGLSDYDGCAQYLLDTARLLQKDSNTYLYPQCRQEILVLMREVRPEASKALQKKLDKYLSNKR